MKLKLTGIKHAKFASQETPCYEATLHVDGAKAAMIMNEGRGGCDHVRWIDRTVGERVDAHFAAMPKRNVNLGTDAKPIWHEMQPSLETWCYGELDRAEALKAIRRATAKKVVGFHDGRELHFQIAPSDLERARPTLEKRHPGIVFLNGLNDDALLAAVGMARNDAVAS